jgi:hypothetical protein
MFSYIYWVTYFTIKFLVWFQISCHLYFYFCGVIAFLN